jgi:hypothetical protein
MVGRPEESLWLEAKLTLKGLAKAPLGRLWLLVMLVFGVIFPILMWLMLPPEPEGGFWVEFGRRMGEMGPYSFVGVMLAVFLFDPWLERHRRRKSAQGKSGDT